MPSLHHPEYWGTCEPCETCRLPCEIPISPDALPEWLIQPRKWLRHPTLGGYGSGNLYVEKSYGGFLQYKVTPFS